MGIVERLSVCRPPNWEDEGREYVVPCDEAADAILALIRERDEARERIAEQEREYQRERIVQVREINARLAAEAALSAAQEEVARYKRKLMQGEAILAGWTRIDRIKLAAGEMTAQEARTALAVAKGIAASVRSAIAVMECGGEAKGACPACGCEEANSRNLWTCECPAPRPEAVGEDGG